MTVSAVMGVEVGTSRAWKLADELGLARVIFVNMLDRERADFFRTLEALRNQLSTKGVAVHIPIGSEHELTGIVDVLHCAPTRAQRVGRKVGRPARSRTSWPSWPPSTARSSSTPSSRPTRRSWSAISKGRSRRARGRVGAEGGRDERRRLPGRLRCRDEEPRHARAPRPPRRGRSLAGEEGLADRRRRCRDRGVRLQDRGRPVRGAHQRLSRVEGHRHGRHDAREPAGEGQGADGHAPRRAGEGAPRRSGLRRG